MRLRFLLPPFSTTYNIDIAMRWFTLFMLHQCLQIFPITVKEPCKQLFGRQILECLVNVALLLDGTIRVNVYYFAEATEGNIIVELLL